MQAIRLCLILACFFLSAVSAQATVRMVPSQYVKIQDAVDAASDGDTVLLAPKTYYTAVNDEEDDLNIMIVNKGLTIMGAGTPSQVVFVGMYMFNRRGFTVINAPSPTRFLNLTFNATWSPGWDSVTQLFSGGGIQVLNSEVSISNCVFYHSRADHAGGGVYARDSKLRIENCDFDGCEAFEPGGGAIFCTNCSLCDISNCRFFNNDVGYSGGAIFTTGSNLTIRDCDFSDNRALGSGSVTGFGGAIYTQHGAASISHCNFLGNNVRREGGAIASWDCSLRIDSSLFADNYVRCASVGDPPVLTGEGGALQISEGTCEINSCTFVGNRTACGTASVAIWTFPPPQVNHSIIANSTGSLAYSGNANFTCSDIFGNELGDWTGTIASQLGQNGNVTADPQFCLAFPGDYRIALGSPCDPAVNECNLLIGSERTGCDIVCGDADFSGSVSISDAVFLIRYIFANGDPPQVPSSGDVSCNGVVNISDVVYLVNYIFASGPVPCAACP